MKLTGFYNELAHKPIFPDKRTHSKFEQRFSKAEKFPKRVKWSSIGPLITVLTNGIDRQTNDEDAENIIR